jgi:hypothetical protein
VSARGWCLLGQVTEEFEPSTWCQPQPYDKGIVVVHRGRAYTLTVGIDDTMLGAADREFNS